MCVVGALSLATVFFLLNSSLPLDQRRLISDVALLAGGIAGAAVSYYVAYHSGLSFLWPSTFGLVATLAVGWVMAWVWPAPLSAPGRALTWSAVMRRNA